MDRSLCHVSQQMSAPRVTPCLTQFIPDIREYRMSEVGLMKTVPGEFRMKTIETTEREQIVAANSRAWKGTVLLVGMISLLVLLSGCYTVVATHASGRLVDRFEGIEYEEWDIPVEEEVVPDQQVLIYEEPQGVGVQIPSADFDTGVQGVGIRYRHDYGYDPYGYSPWVRRLYVDCYYNVNQYYRYRPQRLAFGWSVGWLWGGFGYDYGWYDPYYWDLWWSDPFWYYDAGYSWYWYPWRWSYVQAGWYWPYRFDNYYWYDPFYYDPYWGSYWYGGRGTGIIVSSDYKRRSFDRRNGLAEARNARGGNRTGRDAATGTERDRTTQGDNPLTDARRRRDRSTPVTDGSRTTSRRDPRTRADNNGSKIRQKKIRAVPPATQGVVGGVKPLREKPATTTGPASAKNRNERTNSGSSTSRTIFRTLGQILGRTRGSSRGSGSSGSSARSGSRNRTTGSSPPRTTTTRRPRTSRPPPETTASTNPTSTRTTSRTTVMRTRTTRSNPGANTSRPTTTSRTYTRPRTTTSRPTTSSRPRTTTSRPPPRTSSGSRTTSSRPPRTTTSRPSSRTSSRPRTTTSRPTRRTSSGSRTTGSRPPRTTASRPPPEVITSASGLTYHSYVSTPVSNYGVSNRSHTTSFRSADTGFLTGMSGSYAQSNSYSDRSYSSGSMATSSSSSSMNSGSRTMSSGMSRSGSRTSSTVAQSRTRRPPR